MHDVTLNKSAPPPRVILFVCTGNTCRSPLAEVICKRLLAERLGCQETELPERGYVVRSAGIAAIPGDSASSTAIEIANELNTDLTAHRSRLVNPELLATATDIVTMTRTHSLALSYRFPGEGPKPEILCGEDGDLPDPIGGDREIYRICADMIEYHLRRLLPRWLDDQNLQLNRDNVPG